MKKQIFTLALLAGLALALSGCSETPVTPAGDSGTDSAADKAASLELPREHSYHQGAVVVANRASGSI